jgi:uncharacterized repeat protein (TIGR04076 family)
MEIAELWKRFQKHMGYTDDEMKIFRSDPEKVKMVTESPDFTKSRIIAEVIESHGCHAQHKVGDKFVMNASGQLITGECPKKICLSALTPVSNTIPAFYERFISKSDPNYERSHTVQCTDVGFDKGGWGKILMKVYVEKIS